MSHTYHLLCVDTLEVLDLGKFACLDEMGVPIPWHATGWLDQSDGRRIQGDELRTVVEKFLILRRGKELRVVPDVFLGEIDPTGEALQRIDTFSEVMKQEVNPEPDTYDDARRIPVEVADRLKRNCAERIGECKGNSRDY
jgi:hypothetical protein